MGTSPLADDGRAFSELGFFATMENIPRLCSRGRRMFVFGES